MSPSGRTWPVSQVSEFVAGKMLGYLCMLSGTVTLTPLTLSKKDLVLGPMLQQILSLMVYGGRG